MIHGCGEMIYSDGSTYKGRWAENNSEGYKLYKWAIGDQNIGEF